MPPSLTTDAPRRLGRYELLFMLGQGGMGEVHLARLTGAAGFEKLCIVKTILPAMQADTQFVERFHHEARVLVQLNHSNIAQVYDMGEAEGTLYMAIEYVPGVDLSRVESRTSGAGEPMPVAIAVFLARQICEALDYAHRKTGPEGAPLGIVHRDVSPQNVMVSFEGEVKVIDFGLAKSAARSKHTLPSTVMGKLGYMSPEQALARPVDQRSDIFSAGIVVWEMLAGRALYGGATMAEMMAMMANPEIPPLTTARDDVSETLDSVVRRALAKDPLQRYSRAEEFSRSLNELAVREGLSISAEEVGNYVRARCATEFAAERKLQSQLSMMRKKKSSGGFAVEAAEQPKLASSPEFEGTFVRSSQEQLTPAERALSTMATPAPVSGGVVRGPASGPKSLAGASVPAPGATSGPVQVPKQRWPMIAGLVLGGLALAGGGALYFSSRSEPAKAPALATAEKIVPAPIQALPEVPVREPVKAAPAEPAAPVVAAPAAATEKPIGELEAKGPFFKVLREAGKSYVILARGQKLAEGDTLVLVGQPKEGSSKRDVYGEAAVLEVKKNIVMLLIDKDLVLPQELYSTLDVGPKGERARPGARKAALEAAREKEKEAAAKPAEPEKVAAATPKLKEEEAPAPAAATPVAEKVAPPAPTTPQQPAMQVAPFPGNAPPPAVVSPTPSSAPTPSAPVAAAAQAQAPAAAQMSAMVRVTKGAFGGRQVYLTNTNRYTLSGCQVRLPDNRAYTFAPREILQPRQEMGFDYQRFIADGRPPHPGADRGMALLWCREGYAYVSVRFER